MFATLTAEPQVFVTRGALSLSASWMTGRPVLTRVSDREELAPGIWYVREKKQAWPVSVLDIGEFIPSPEVEPVKRIFGLVEDWHARARCNDGPRDDLFFGEEEDELSAGTQLSAHIAIARGQFCRECPVVRDCLMKGLQEREPFGIWGGTSKRQRERKFYRRMARGESIEELADEWLTHLAAM